MKAAVIDIGSNSIRYMEGAAEHGRVLFRTEKRLYTTRLAEGQDESGNLGEVSMARSLAALFECASMAREHGLPAFSYATSAVREAKNRAEFLSRVESETGLTVDVLTGSREGKLAHLGAGGPIIDVGGGSCQISTDAASVSYAVGCVRGRDLLEKERLLNAPWRVQYAAVEERLALLALDAPYVPEDFRGEGVFFGAGGTLTTLAALLRGLTEFSRERIEDTVLAEKHMIALIETLYAMGEARREHPLLLKRHDVILPGAYVALALLKRLSGAEIHVTDRDGMEGYLLSLAGD